MSNMQKENGEKGERIAKRMARAGLCSRREAEAWILAGRVAVDGKKLTSPACVVTDKSRITVDGQVLPQKESTRLFLFHKPKEFVTTNKDEKGRATIFDILPKELPRVVTVGRLDMNTEGLLLLTNNGELARHLELPATGWVRRYRVRAFGRVDERKFEKLKEGTTIDGIRYAPIGIDIDKGEGNNIWMTVSLSEGKNREIRKVMEYAGLQVNRLIRTSYGPFQLGKLPKGAVEEISGKALKSFLGGSFSL